ncbi:hypothetical protein PSI23_20330 [Xenorhabdus sp. XENO-10]|uniref:Uncharacterized protein n=1 Tax=Xenorhabdus yunnanensis TaxID=3025878 RepID=A0ABT5LKC2_9GAMM|nr:hypothetical protein [Xenorhabdus yunnanensis]MDC9591563.1 hypothetical protein [Xenorhabdus yunnanensis]
MYFTAPPPALLVQPENKKAALGDLGFVIRDQITLSVIKWRYP